MFGSANWVEVKTLNNSTFLAKSSASVVDSSQPLHVTASIACDGSTTIIKHIGYSSLTTKEWMTTPEAAILLGISEKTLLNLSSNGKVPYYKFQRRNRYLRSELLKLLLATKRGGFHGY